MLAELGEVKAGNSVEDPSSINYETLSPAKYSNRKSLCRIYSNRTVTHGIVSQINNYWYLYCMIADI